MVADGLWSIGELAARAGATVKTVRFYSDRGLLPEAARSGGGHRRYGPEALDRLRSIRSLRSLGLPLPEVERVLGGEDGTGDDVLVEALTGRLCEVGSQLTELRWREASLRLVRDGAPGERAARLRLVGAVPLPPDADAVVRFWRRALPVRLPRAQVASVLDAVVPEPPAAPTPAQVLAFARLHALVSDPRLDRPELRPAPPLPEGEYRPAVLYDGLAEAYGLAFAAGVGGDRDGGTGTEAGRGPGEEPGPAAGALDGFVAAYAAALGVGDTPAFRRRLLGLLARHDGPVISRRSCSPPAGRSSGRSTTTSPWRCAPRWHGRRAEPGPAGVAGSRS
ncbi:helix-turn-helix domain-containing protein [Streptomyces sp. NPDC003327]